jgi:hypothetical protein
MPVHTLLAGSGCTRVVEVNLAVALGLATGLLVEEPHLLHRPILAELRLQICVRRPPVELPNEQRRAARAVTPANGATVPDHDGATAEVSSRAVDPVALLNLVVLRQRRRSDRRLRWRGEVGLGGGYPRSRTGHPGDAYLLLRRWGLRRRRREGVGRWMLLRLRLGRWRKLLLRLVLVLLRRRCLLGRRRWGRRLVGGVEEAVADVDVVVEVVEVVVVAVVLVDVLDGGDGLAAVERRVAVGIHGGGRASSRVRVFRIRVDGGGERSWGLFSEARAILREPIRHSGQVLPCDVGCPMHDRRTRFAQRLSWSAWAPWPLMSVTDW